MEEEFYENKEIVFDFNSSFFGGIAMAQNSNSKKFLSHISVGVEILAELHRKLQSRPELIYLKLNRKFLIQQITIQF